MARKTPGTMRICRILPIQGQAHRAYFGKERKKMTSKKVWFVTGCSKGLGHALVKKLLEEGYPVAAASRDAQTLVNVFGSEGDGFCRSL